MSDNGSEEWEVECIRKATVHWKQKSKIVWYYRVKWKNWDDKDNTWEPKAHLQNSQAAIKGFWNSVDLGGRDHTCGLDFKTGEVIVAPDYHDDDDDTLVADTPPTPGGKRKRASEADKDSELPSAKKGKRRASTAPESEHISSSEDKSLKGSSKQNLSASAAPPKEFSSASHATPPASARKPQPPLPPPRPATKPASKILAGKFDLYFCGLAFLQDAFHPRGAAHPDYAALYTELRRWQRKPDFSMRVALKPDGATGRFACAQVMNPMSDEPLDVNVTKGKWHPALAFAPGDCAVPAKAGTYPGWQGLLVVDPEGSGAGCGMIKEGGGLIKMRKVWSGAGVGAEGGGGEVWEGSWALEVEYGPTLRKKHFGSGERFCTTFWSIRALRDNSTNLEIGIDFE